MVERQYIVSKPLQFLHLTLAFIKKNSTLKQILIICILLIFGATETFACGCNGLKKINSTDYNDAGEIFIGRVISVVENREKWEKEVTFEVIDKLKPTEEKKEITITTGFDVGSCGLSINEGDKWYVFASVSNKGLLYAGLCGRSLHLDKRFKIRDYGIKYAFLEKRAWRKKHKRVRKEKQFIRQKTKR